MKKIIFVILLSTFGAVSIVGLNLDDYNDCMQGKQKSACQKLIDNGLISVEQCDKSTCEVVALIFFLAEKYHQALPYYEKGCDLKSAVSCFAVGVICQRRLDVKQQDFFKAKMYYEKACNLNFAGGCGELGFNYYKGYGVRQDKSVAKKYFGKACDLGYQMGCENYKILNEQGIK